MLAKAFSVEQLIARYSKRSYILIINSFMLIAFVYKSIYNVYYCYFILQIEYMTTSFKIRL